MPLFIRPEKTLNQHVMDAQPKRIFHYAAFRYLFFARLFTVLGNGIAPIALAFAVLDIGGTPAQLGIVVAARSLFNVIFLMVGGVLADRYPRGRVLFSSSMLAALSQALIAWLILMAAQPSFRWRLSAHSTVPRRALRYRHRRRWCRKPCPRRACVPPTR